MKEQIIRTLEKLLADQKGVTVCIESDRRS